MEVLGKDFSVGLGNGSGSVKHRRRSTMDTSSGSLSHYQRYAMVIFVSIKQCR
ncbi:hypothetical protein SARC_16777, partial [Sphaeroforma arctica JP610]